MKFDLAKLGMVAALICPSPVVAKEAPAVESVTVDPNSSVASGPTGWRSIAELNCNLTATTCSLVINGGVVGPAGCEGKVVIWSMDAPRGQDLWDLFQTAIVSNRRVELNISPTCDSGYPSLTWASIGGPVHHTLNPVAAERGAGSGKVTSIRTHMQYFALFTTESRTSKAPGCDQNTWAISLNTEEGRAMYSLLLTAHAQQKDVTVTGSGYCDVVAGHETPQIIRVN